MKKSVLVIAFACGISGAFAQDLTSKKGEPILPEANDWAIGMSIDPIFNYLGNALHGQNASGSTNGGAGAPGVGFLNQNYTIIGKKFIDEKSAYRALVRIGFTNQTQKGMIGDASVTTPAVYPAAPAMVEDKWAHKNTNIMIGAGKEWRRGKTRLQGFYGADAMIWLTSASDKYTYGNALSTSSTNPVGVTGHTTDFSVNPPYTQFIGSPANIGTDPGYGYANRITKYKSGMGFGIGVRGFIGAEYFIFPKISLGAEYGWGLGFQTQAKGTTSTESVGTPSSGTTQTVGTMDTKTSGNSKFGIDTDLNQNNMFGFKGSNTGTASLRATFHF